MNDDDVTFADSEFLAQRDLAVRDFRASDKETKHKIIEKMLTLRHNMKYNKHLLSVYMKAKGIFDTMVEEHRSQLHYLDEIYRHVNQLIRENLSTTSKKPNGMMSELIKDKKRIGALLKKMRNSYDKLMNVDTVIGVTIDKMNEITFMDDDTQHDDVEDGGDSGIDEDDGETEEDDDTEEEASADDTEEEEASDDNDDTEEEASDDNDDTEEEASDDNDEEEASDDDTEEEASDDDTE